MAFLQMLFPTETLIRASQRTHRAMPQIFLQEEIRTTLNMKGLTPATNFEYELSRTHC